MEVNEYTKEMIGETMRHARWICILIVFLATGAWAQEEAPPAQPKPPETKTVPIAPGNAPQLSEKDQLLACPASMLPSSAKILSNAEGGSVNEGHVSIKPPKVTNQVDASFSDEARKMAKEKHLKSFQAISLIRLIVDSQGNPQNASS